ncbi:hypothetical protein KC19_VG077200 [Ceratodon purpureus]|uniref:Uncharacterized protein n=1 Tax=Ceratodon purpureus TaxID=3225 RepID=A0A8T0HN28_CERPU|nr:hypothetical protein KC19_VG077200 [Ceratodon purpureus]
MGFSSEGYVASSSYGRFTAGSVLKIWWISTVEDHGYSFSDDISNIYGSKARCYSNGWLSDMLASMACTILASMACSILASMACSIKYGPYVLSQSSTLLGSS